MTDRNVLFYKVDVKSKFDALPEKNPRALYWILETSELYCGDQLFGTGREASETAAGLLSPEDYIELQRLLETGSTSSFTPVAGEGIKVENNKISVNLSPVETNVLTVKDGALYVPATDLTEVEKSVINTLSTTFVQRDYEITDGLFVDTLVKYNNNEIRVMFANNTPWFKQNVGETGDASKYYMGMKAYAPNDAVYFKEDMAKIIVDNTFYDFNGEFAGTDVYGRHYSIVWLPVAAYDGAAWTYYGAASTEDHFVGWDYSVEWYNADKVKIGADTIHINLANEDCFTSILPSYAKEFAKATEIQEIKEAISWQEM